jgi:hypothetical protein
MGDGRPISRNGEWEVVHIGGTATGTTGSQVRSELIPVLADNETVLDEQDVRLERDSERESGVVAENRLSRGSMIMVSRENGLDNIGAWVSGGISPRPRANSKRMSSRSLGDIGLQGIGKTGADTGGFEGDVGRPEGVCKT